MKNRIQQSIVKIVWDMNFEIVLDIFTYKNRFNPQKWFLGPQLWCRNWKNDWFFIANFSEKIHLQNKWKLKSIKRAIVVKNVFLNKCCLQNQFLIHCEEFIANFRFSSFSIFWNFRHTTWPPQSVSVMGRQWSGSCLTEMSSGHRSDVQNHIVKDSVVLRTPSHHLGSARSARLRDLPSR